MYRRTGTGSPVLIQTPKLLVGITWYFTTFYLFTVSPQVCFYWLRSKWLFWCIISVKYFEFYLII